MRWLSNGRTTCTEMKDKSNEAFTLFPMCKICKNLWMESLRNFSVLLISFQELKVVYKHQFAETDKMVWFNTEVTSELGLNSYLTRVSKRPERAHCYFSVEWTLELTNNLTEGTNKVRDCLSLKRVRALLFFFSLSLLALPYHHSGLRSWLKRQSYPQPSHSQHHS